MKTAILIPGVFNPVTNAHVEMGKITKSLYPEADIWYIPANGEYVQNKMNGEEFLSDAERLACLRTAVQEYGFNVSDIEVNGLTTRDENNKIIHYTFSGKTYDTVEFFKKATFDGEKYDKIYLCFGVDKMKDFHKWYRVENLIEETKILVLDRLDKKFSPNISLIIRVYRSQFIPLGVDGAISDISSTKVREAFKEGDLSSVKNDIPTEIYYYLEGKLLNNYPQLQRY